MSIDLMQPVNLGEVVATGDLAMICRAFGSLVGVGVGIVGGDGKRLGDSRTIPEACRYLHGFPSVERLCAEMHEEMVQTARPAEGESFAVRTCHAGFIYAVVPLVYEGDVAGKVVLGPFRPPVDMPGTAAGLAPGVDAEQFLALVERSKRTSLEGVRRLVLSIQDILGVVLRLGHKVMATGIAHTLSLEESYRQLVDKNRELEENRLRLEELDRLKSDLLATMSHELRTPLTSIIGYSEMLSSEMGGKLTPDQLKYANTIREKGDGLLRVISTILDASSLESGRIELNRMRTPISDLVEGAVARATGSSPRKDVEVEMGQLAPAVAVVDPEMIEKAIYHLVDNAMKFSNPSGVVRVQVREVDEKPEGDDAIGYVVMAPMLRWVEIMVQDYGVGIPVERQEDIFKPLVQVDASATRHHGGLGLGLALVKHYVTLNGGRVRVRSSEGEGSTFLLRLPREYAER